MKIFFDTNVILDIVLQREDEYNVKKIVEISRQNEFVRIYASYLTIANMAFILRKTGISIVRDCIRSVSRWCNILSCGDMQIRDALSNSSPDFEDSLQIMCAEENMCDVIITRNPAHFRKYTEIPVLSPEEFASHFQ